MGSVFQKHSNSKNGASQELSSTESRDKKAKSFRLTKSRVILSGWLGGGRGNG